MNLDLEQCSLTDECCATCKCSQIRHHRPIDDCFQYCCLHRGICRPRRRCHEQRVVIACCGRTLTGPRLSARSHMKYARVQGAFSMHVAIARPPHEVSVLDGQWAGSERGATQAFDLIHPPGAHWIGGAPTDGSEGVHGANGTSRANKHWSESARAAATVLRRDVVPLPYRDVRRGCGPCGLSHATANTLAQWNARGQSREKYAFISAILRVVILVSCCIVLLCHHPATLPIVPIAVPDIFLFWYVHYHASLRTT